MARYMSGAVLSATVEAIRSQVRISEEDAVKAAGIALHIGQQIGRNWDESAQGDQMDDVKSLTGEDVVSDGWDVFVDKLDSAHLPD